MGLVGDEGQLEVGAEAALLAGLLGPGQVREVGVGRDAEDGGVDGAKTGQRVVVLDDLGRADEGEIKGVEEEDDPGRKKKNFELALGCLIFGAPFSLGLVQRESTYHCPR